MGTNIILMKANFSESLFEFCHLCELKKYYNKNGVVVVPDIPSTRAEKKLAWDVHLQLFGGKRAIARSLFIQYKRPYYIKRNDKINKSYIQDHGGPFYKFNITDNSKSNQHQLLVSFAKKGREVYYCAPLIYEKDQLQLYLTNGSLLSKSFFLPLNDMIAYRTDGHFVTYDEKYRWYSHSSNTSHQKDGLSWDDFYTLDKKINTKNYTLVEINRFVKYFKRELLIEEEEIPPSTIFSSLLKKYLNINWIIIFEAEMDNR